MFTTIKLSTSVTDLLGIQNKTLLRPSPYNQLTRKKFGSCNTLYF